MRTKLLHKRGLALLFIFASSMLWLTGCKTPDQTTSEDKTTIYVFIAASLNNSMTKIQAMYKEVNPNVTIIYNPDSSGTLQKQIEEGAECDLFFSAAQKQMNELESGGYIRDDSINNILENKVVLIKPTGGDTLVTDFENIYKAKNIALAGKEVPAGAYAREILQTLGIWEQVSELEINECTNVTNVLAAISEASNEVGIVYATDANSVKDSVEIIAYAPEDSLITPIIYPAGLVKNIEADEKQSKAALDFLEYLSSEEAIALFEEYGFSAYIE